jgi:hypothetical protein
MPEASRHAKPKPTGIRLWSSILAAAALAGVAAAFVLLQGGTAAPKPAGNAILVRSAAAAVNGNDQEHTTAVRYQIAIQTARIVMRNTAAAWHRNHTKPAAARHAAPAPHAPQQTAPQTQQTAVPPTSTATQAPTAHSSGDAASSPLGICIRKAEEGGSYAWGPGNGGGAYQFLLGTWEKYGGAASEYGVAGSAYQNQIFDNAIAAGGASNWTAYDGC